MTKEVASRPSQMPGHARRSSTPTASLHSLAICSLRATKQRGRRSLVGSWLCASILGNGRRSRIIPNSFPTLSRRSSAGSRQSRRWDVLRWTTPRFATTRSEREIASSFFSRLRTETKTCGAIPIGWTLRGIPSLGTWLSGMVRIFAWEQHLLARRSASCWKRWLALASRSNLREDRLGSPVSTQQRGMRPHASSLRGERQIRGRRSAVAPSATARRWPRVRV